MKIQIFTGFVAALCVLLTSCYPYPENPQRKKGNPPTQRKTAEEQAKLKEQEAKKKQEEELKKKQETTGETPGTGPTTGNPTTPPPPPPPPVEPKRTNWPVANKVPGREGYVISPYNNKQVDVSGIPSGTEVQDPFYPPSEKKHFIVP